MKILYASSVCSPKVLNYIFDISVVKPGQAIQKFHRLLLEGFSNDPINQVTALSDIPITRVSSKKIFYNIKNDKYKNIQFKYLITVNLPVLKNIFVFLLSFFSVCKFIIENRKEKKIVFCDILNISICSASFFACKLLNQKICVLITDLPSDMVLEKRKKSLKNKIYLKISQFLIFRFDYYIGLTKFMNELVNPHHKPFLVIEGLVDSNINFSAIEQGWPKAKSRVIMYAGGLDARYGLNNLVEGFIKLPNKDVELHLYGDGEFKEKLEYYCNIDSRVKYFGVIKNDLMMEKLNMASLLVNPRPTKDEYTKFSFPSKNLEYMSTGVPLLTTRLKGMPREYYEHVYIIEDESSLGISNILLKTLVKSDYELREFGERSKKFVLSNKSNKVQADKILKFLK